MELAFYQNGYDLMADNLQKIYASDTQTVTALLVQEGQTV